MQANEGRVEELRASTPEPEKTTQDSLPSLSSIFKPEEFFDLEPIEEAALSVMCCNND